MLGQFLGFHVSRSFDLASATDGFALAIFLAIGILSLHAQQPPVRARGPIIVTVVDETGVAVQGALVTLAPAAKGKSFRGETDIAGQTRFNDAASGEYLLSVEKSGFYPVSGRSVDLRSARTVEISVPHQQEYSERVEVTYTPPAIDPQQTAQTQKLSDRDITNAPYSTNRDYRNALPLIPGVTPDNNGQIHVNGSNSTQIDERLDGFDISDPVSGLLNLRVSPDALRSTDVIGSRLPADLGKGSGEALSLTTGMGDDHFRFSATDFIPSLQSRKGIHLEGFTPRATFSGPIRRGKAWFYDAAQGEYDLTIITELPNGADEAPFMLWNNLAKAQVNLNSTNLLTGSFLVNGLRSPNDDLGPFHPLEATTDLAQDSFVANLKDQAYLPGGGLFEAGFGFSQFALSDRPRGSEPYVIRPEAVSGNYFETRHTTARRAEAIANLFLPSFAWHGRHQLRLGADFDRLTDEEAHQRGEILIYREDGTLDRRASFAGPNAFDLDNFEASGYVEDGWSATTSLFLQSGLRLDWNKLLGGPVISPRLAASYMATSDGKTKVSVGAGVVYAATNLKLLSFPLQGRRVDLFYGPDGQTPLGAAVITSFVARSGALAQPRFVNWSVGLERMLTGETHFELEYIGKRGFDDFDYDNIGSGPAPGLPSGLFQLRNDANDRYDAVRGTVRFPFLRSYMILVSYTRSRNHSTTVLRPTFENPVFSPQLAGPLPWDSPNRLLSWGWAPLIKKFMLAYVVDWRTGYPFSIVDQDQRLVGLPDTRRFPDFFALNLFIEKRIRLLGYEWAVRGGFDNITNRQNPTVVVNNIDSPQFLTFSGVQGRSFTGRIRFLGRK